MLSPEEAEIAKRSILLASIPQDAVDDILSRAVRRDFERGSSIFLQGEQAKHVFIVISGWAKLYRISPNGAEAVVGVFTKGRSFGEAVAFRDDVYPVAAEAVTDCRLLQVQASQLLNMMTSRPELCTAILAATFRHLHALVEQIEQLKAQTGSQRVAEFLLDLCPEDGSACTVTLPYEKVLIAGRLGMKPESLSRAFRRLKEVGVTVSKNHAAIENIEELRTYVAQDPADAWNSTI